MTKLDYAIVVATRNRLDALKVSLPLFLEQSRPPARIKVVDRSDDHAAVVNFIHTLAQGASVPVSVEYGKQANLPAQRNQGIEGLREAVTMLPDDDSLWFSETAAELMAVYEADSPARIGGVSGWISTRSPLAPNATPKNARRFMRRPRIEALRNRLEERFAPQPFNLFARRSIADLSQQSEVLEPGVMLYGGKVTETMSGWRMSYRTAVVQSLRYDETLGSRVGYAQHEDKDMSLRAQQAGHLIVSAPNAMVFHNVHPGKRTDGFSYGFFWLLNYIYICKKAAGLASEEYHPGYFAVKRYMRYKAFLYRLRFSNTYDREVARGAKVALSAFEAIWATPISELRTVYGAIADRGLMQE